MPQNLQLTRQPNGANIRASEGAGTTTLLGRDARWQVFNLSAARTVVLPSDGSAGDVWQISNVGTGVLTLQSSGLNTITVLGNGSVSVAALVAAPTTAGNWTLIQKSGLSYVYATGSGQSTSNVVVPFATELLDTNSEYNTGTGVFTAKRAMVVRVATAVRTDSGTPSYTIQIRKNSATVIRASVAQIAVTALCEALISLASGDTVDIYCGYSSGPANLTFSTELQYVSIQELL